MKRKLRFVSLLLIVAMMMTLVPAGLAETAEERPYMEITIYNEANGFVGLQGGWLGKIIKDKFNLGINCVCVDNTKFATSMAAGYIGDVYVFGNVVMQDNFRDALELGMLYDWNTDGNLEKYAPYIAEHYPGAKERGESQWGGFYGIGHGIQEAGLGMGGNIAGGPSIRYDLYKAVGAPKLESKEDYLDVLKKMLELYPVNEDGLPVYGISYWNTQGSDNGLYPGLLYANQHGYINYGTLFWHATEDDSQSMLDADSYYMKGIRFAYEANQMGLLDPDSIAQTYDDCVSKLVSDRLLFAESAMWTQAYNTEAKEKAGKSMQVVPFEGEQSLGYAGNPYGGNTFVAITNKAKDPTRILELFNWQFTDEGIMTCINGPRGLTWDLDENNKPYLTELGYACMANPDTPIPEEYGGGTFESGRNHFENYERNNAGLVALTGESAQYNAWSSYLASTVTGTKREWVDDHEGYVSYHQYLVDKGYMVVTSNEIVMSRTPVPDQSIEIQQMRNSVKSVINEYGWKMIYAANDEEYNKLYDEMIAKSYGMGYDKVVEYDQQCLDILNAAKHEMFD